MLSAPLIASMYVGDELSFITYAMLSQPEFHDKIRAEADALFANGDPDSETITGPAIDVTRRFIMECMRLYPIVPMSVRNAMLKISPIPSLSPNKKLKFVVSEKRRELPV